MAADASEALEILQHEPQDLVISDLNLPGMSGLELLKRIKTRYPETEVVMITAFGTVPTAVEAIKSGAYDYLTKPIHLHELSTIVERVLERLSLIEEVGVLRKTVDEKYGFDKIIGRSKALLFAVDQAAARGAHRCNHTDPRRNGDRQRSARQSHPLQQPPARPAVCHHQLRGNSQRFVGIRAVWPPARLVYRSRNAQEGQGRSSGSGYSVSGRDRRTADGVAGSFVAAYPRAGRSKRSALPVRPKWT